MRIPTRVPSRVLRLVAVGGIVVATAMPGVAFAKDVGTYGNGTDTNGSSSGTDASGAQGATDPVGTHDGSLPFTGGDVAGLALIGAGAIVGGAALSRSGRRLARA